MSYVLQQLLRKGWTVNSIFSKRSRRFVCASSPSLPGLFRWNLRGICLKIDAISDDNGLLIILIWWNGIRKTRRIGGICTDIGVNFKVIAFNIFYCRYWMRLGCMQFSCCFTFKFLYSIFILWFVCNSVWHIYVWSFHNVWWHIKFLPRDAMLSQDVCPPICLSHLFMVSKRYS